MTTCYHLNKQQTNKQQTTTTPIMLAMKAPTPTHTHKHTTSTTTIKRKYRHQKACCSNPGEVCARIVLVDVALGPPFVGQFVGLVVLRIGLGNAKNMWWGQCWSKRGKCKVHLPQLKGNPKGLKWFYRGISCRCYPYNYIIRSSMF